MNMSLKQVSFIKRVSSIIGDQDHLHRWCPLFNCAYFLYFQVTCDTVDPSLNPVKGRINYDARAQKAEFIPHSTLYPNSKYTVLLMGRAVTTSRCSHSVNIKNAELHFETCDPAPKNIGIRLKGQAQEVSV